MTTPALVEAYARQMKAVVEARTPGWEGQVVKLADMLLVACESLRNGVVTVKRGGRA
jgi:hypothetical protein